MSFRAELLIENRTYRVLSCSHTFSMETDQTGRPSSRPRFGLINLQIESIDNVFLITKAVHNGALTGVITFKKRDQEVKMKEYQFENAFVVEHSERFQSFGDSPMTIDLTLSVHALTIETNSEVLVLTNDWPV